MRTENNRAFREREITRDQFIDCSREIDEIERQRADQRPWCQAPTSARACLTGGSVSHPVVADCAGVTRSIMIDVTELMGLVFSGLSALVIEGVEDAGEVIVVRARTRDGAVACPGCGSETARVHGYYERTA